MKVNKISTRRRVIKLYSSPYSLYLDNPLFESRGPMYVISPLNENHNFEIINENSMVRGLAKDAIQFAISAASEYGLGAITMPAGGAGVAVGPGVESVVDAVFAADSISGVILAVKNFTSNVGEFSKLFNDAMSKAKNCVQDPDGFYSAIRETVAKGINVLGKGVETKVDEMSEKLKGLVSALINKLVDALVEGIKVLIPDATISVAVSTSIRTTMATAAENSYTTLVELVEKVGQYKDFISDDKKTKKFFSEVIDQLIDLCMKMIEKINETGWAKMLAGGFMLGLAAGAFQAAAIKKLGPGGLKQVIDMMKKNKPKLLEMISTIINVVIPATYAATAMYQILMKGEYKQKVKGAVPAPNEPASAKGPEGKGVAKESIVRVDRWQKLAGIVK